MSFTLGDKTAAQLKIRLLEETQIPVLSETRDRTVNIPGRSGTWDFGADLGPRYFKLECGFIDSILDSSTKLQAAVRDLAAHLVNASGKPRDLSLEFDREPGKVWTVRYAGSLPIQRRLYHSKGFFTLPLTAFDPHAYVTEKNQEATITTSPTEINVEVEGNVGTPAVIVIRNNGANTINGFTLRREIEEE